MTVGELIEKLKELQPDAVVNVSCDGVSAEATEVVDNYSEVFIRAGD